MPFKSALVSYAYVDTARCSPFVEALHSSVTNVSDAGGTISVAAEAQEDATTLEQDLQRTDVLIVLVTTSTVDSMRVSAATRMFSAQMAQDPSRRLIPVLLDPCELPPLLARQPWKVDATTLTPTQAVNQLLALLEAGDKFPASMQTIVSSQHAARIPLDISRRTLVVAGLAGAAGVIALLGTGALWWSRTRPGAVATPSPMPAPVIYRGHSLEISSAAWSPDGKRIASAGADETVQVWDAIDGGHVYIYHGHSSFVSDAAWSPDGKRIASAGGDNTVQVWDAADGGNVFIYHGHSDSVFAICWSPDGRRIASGGRDTTVQVWDASDGGNLLTYAGHRSSVGAIDWSPDGKRIASASFDATVQVWDATYGIRDLIYRRHADSVTDVAWSLDGKRIASASWNVHVWNPVEGVPSYIYHGHFGAGGQISYVSSVAWSPNGRRIASTGDGVQVWDAVDGGHVYIYRGHMVNGQLATVNDARWSPDGRRIVSVGGESTVQVWYAR